MTKIVLINSCLGLYGGIEALLFNIFISLPREEYDVTFLTCGKTTYDLVKDEIEKHGGHIEEIPIYADSFINQIRLYRRLRRYFRRLKPDIVHINSGGLLFHFIASRAAYKEKVSSIILHSHNFAPNENKIKKELKNILKNRIAKYGNRFLACSQGAAEWIFPKELVAKGFVEILPNGIDTKHFAFDPEKRDSFRANLGIGNELVIGNVGRFQRQKNHDFIIKLFGELIKYKPNAKLILIGEGELQKDIQKLVEQQALDKNVFFLGVRNDIDFVLSALDVFIMPSLFDGFPIAAIEAQTSGVRVILADTIPKAINLSGDVEFLSIESDSAIKNWVDKICTDFSERDRYSALEKVVKAGYDRSFCCRRMRDIYEGKA